LNIARITVVLRAIHVYTRSLYTLVGAMWSRILETHWTSPLRSSKPRWIGHVLHMGTSPQRLLNSSELGDLVDYRKLTSRRVYGQHVNQSINLDFSKWPK